jgi:hypothetical protein
VDLKGRGNLCRGGSALGDRVFNDRLTVAILTAVGRAQKSPAIAYVISNRFLDVFDMRAADNLVIDNLSHRLRRLSAPACTAILKCRLVAYSYSSVAIQSRGWPTERMVRLDMHQARCPRFRDSRWRVSALRSSAAVYRGAIDRSLCTPRIRSANFCLSLLSEWVVQFL